MLHGKGSAKFANGDTYQGGFAYGRFAGAGVYRFASDGATLACKRWSEGELDGEVEVSAPSMMAPAMVATTVAAAAPPPPPPPAPAFSARGFANYANGRSDGNATVWYAKDACVESGSLHLDRSAPLGRMNPARGVAVVRQIPFAASTSASTLDPVANSKAVGNASLSRRILPPPRCDGGEEREEPKERPAATPAVLFAVAPGGKPGVVAVEPSALAETVNGVLAGSDTVKFLPVAVHPQLEDGVHRGLKRREWLPRAFAFCLAKARGEEAAGYERGLMVVSSETGEEEEALELSGWIDGCIEAREEEEEETMRVRVGLARGKRRGPPAFAIEWWFGQGHQRRAVEVRRFSSRHPEDVKAELVGCGLLADLGARLERQEDLARLAVVCEVLITAAPSLDVGSWVVAQIAARLRRLRRSSPDARGASGPRMLVVAITPAIGLRKRGRPPSDPSGLASPALGSMAVVSNEAEVEVVNGRVHKLLIELA